MLKLKDKYRKEVVPKMMEMFGYKSPMAVPKIEKITVNCGFGRIAGAKTSSEKKKKIDNVSNILGLITGQKPSLRKARVSVSSFKLRKGMPIGAKVTLRKVRMYDFLERLLWLVLPRSRDFRGIPLKSVDKQGNLTIGLKEYAPFPEVVVERDKEVFGLEITITTNAKNRKESIELLRLMGVPFKVGEEGRKADKK